MKRKIFLLLIVTLLMSIFISACKGISMKDNIVAEDKSIIYDEKFGGFFIDISLKDFAALGFELGDSVDLYFDDGQEIRDIPYYNGYYTKINETLICAYPGYEHIKVAVNCGDDLYKTMSLNDNTKVTAKLNTRGKYFDIQETFSVTYENERSAFDTDESFANFRSLTGGKLKHGLIYRSASPVDNTYNRAPYVDKLAERAGIKYIIDLSDGEEDIKNYISDSSYDSPFAKSIYEKGKICLLNMSASFSTLDYREKVAKGLRAVLANDGPYLIHCLEGKDRTGFVALLIEALCGADYYELQKDYMMTYDNYYHINESDSKKKYNAIKDIKFNDMICFLADIDSVKEIESINLQRKAEEYLCSGGLMKEEISELISIFTK